MPIRGEAFPHLLYHFVLPYSNWETGTVCFSESYESLSEGLQNALWELGGVPVAHQSDRLSAAVNNYLNPEAFTRRYQALLRHYGLQGRKIQAGQAHENGDVEQRHHRFKRALEQALLLRGHRDFDSRGEYEGFLQKLFKQLNSGRQERLREELQVLRRLPVRRVDDAQKERVRVGPSSTIRVKKNTYCVDSRLIGELVEVRLYAERIEVWYGQQQIHRLPRLSGHGKHHINYRYIIDSLVRKPGAFENYRYREELFPTSYFRMAYDLLRKQDRLRAHKEYLKILYLAAKESESGVNEALRWLVDLEQPITAAAVQERLSSGRTPVSIAGGVRGRDQSGHVRCPAPPGGGGRMIPTNELRGQLVGYLKELRLPTIRECFEDMALKAEQESLGYEHYLLEVTARECEVRQQKRIETLLQKSQLPLEKSLDGV